MFEKVNPSHPDKIADRIAGAIVDMAYLEDYDPRIAVEVLIGHGKCHIIAESSVDISEQKVREAVKRISGVDDVDFVLVPQDKHLADNQSNGLKCGDNGIFKGVPLTLEEKCASERARRIYDEYPYDGKYIYTLLDGEKFIICQSHAKTEDLKREYPDDIINPLGDWTGGTDVDTGATNRKLGSDMGGSITGGGLHGKDLSKADVSVNIWAFLKAQEEDEEISCYCAIGDKDIKYHGEYSGATIETVDFEEVVDTAWDYIESVGGFEKFAEWGLV